MSSPRAPSDPTSSPIQDPIAQLLRDLIHERTGMFFDDARVTLVFDKLEPRLKATGRQSYLDYYYLLKYDDHGAEEWLRVMDAFSVQETYFWREVDQVRVLVDQIVPAWFRQTSQPLRIWSAACATGEEPYSLAIALEEGGWGRHPIQLLASDASESALTKARAGLYRERSFRSLPLELRAKYFRPQGDQFLLSEEIRARVSFQRLNLMELEKAPELRDLPVIFCRNVFIYFSLQTIRRVVAEFARRMPPHAYLFVGASESLLKVADDFSLEEMGEAFVYVRQPRAL